MGERRYLLKTQHEVTCKDRITKITNISNTEVNIKIHYKNKTSPSRNVNKTKARKNIKKQNLYIFSLSLCRNSPTRAMAASFLRFIDHTKWQTTFGSSPLDQESARRWDLYLTKHNTQNRHTYISWRNSNPQPQQASGLRTFALDRSATAVDALCYTEPNTQHNYRHADYVKC